MERVTQINAGLEDNSESPHPPPPQFNASLAAAQPVEPLATSPTPPRRRRVGRRFLKGRLTLLAAVLIATLLSAAFGGILLGLHEGIREQQVTESPVAPPVVNQPVVNQKTDEAPKASIPARTVKVSDNTPRISRRPLSVEPAKPDLAQVWDKPVARRVGVIIFGRGKEDRQRGETRRRRYADNDDHQ